MELFVLHTDKECQHFQYIHVYVPCTKMLYFPKNLLFTLHTDKEIQHYTCTTTHITYKVYIVPCYSYNKVDYSLVLERRVVGCKVHTGPRPMTRRQTWRCIHHVWAPLGSCSTVYQWRWWQGPTYPLGYERYQSHPALWRYSSERCSCRYEIHTYVRI